MGLLYTSADTRFSSRMSTAVGRARQFLLAPSCSRIFKTVTLQQSLPPLPKSRQIRLLESAEPEA
ncbi:hypothetical protein Ciccas_011830, partial [Cichlidogyrus casuarinus]